MFSRKLIPFRYPEGRESSGIWNLLHHTTHPCYPHVCFTNSKAPILSFSRTILDQPAKGVYPLASIFIPFRLEFSHSNNISRYFNDQKLKAHTNEPPSYTLFNQHRLNTCLYNLCNLWHTTRQKKKNCFASTETRPWISVMGF